MLAQHRRPTAQPFEVAERPTVELRLGEALVRLGNYDELSITHDMLAPGSPTSITLWRGNNDVPWPESDLWPLTKVFAPFEVSINGSLQMRGIIETRHCGASHAKGSPLILSGRDLSAAAIVADADPRVSLRNSTLENVLARLYGPLGVNLIVGANATDARSAQAGRRPGARVPSGKRSRRRHHVDVFRVKPGEKVAQLAQQLCRRHGYLLFTAPYADGVGVIVDRPDYDSEVLYAFERVRRGASTVSNFIEGKHMLDALKVPTQITVYGRTKHSDPTDAKHSFTLENERLTGPLVASVVPSRPRYIRDPKATTLKIAEQRARREMALAMADYESFELIAQGVGQRGRLYAVNTMCSLVDDETGVRGDHLITRVGFAIGRGGGAVSTLRLVPKGSLVIAPDQEV